MITIVIPIHDLTKAKRDLKRLEFQLYSLSIQEIKPDVVVVTSSPKEAELIRIQDICRKYKADYIYQDRKYLNFGKLINTGYNLHKAKNPFIAVSGVDFIYHPGYTAKMIELINDQNTLVVNWVRMMNGSHYAKLQNHMIREWSFPGNYQRNRGGTAACGIAVTHRDLFDKVGGMCEAIQGLSGMDELFYQCCKRAGAKIIWNDNQVIHLSHPLLKTDGKPLPEQSRNWDIVRRCEKYNVVNWRKFRKFPRKIYAD